MKRFAGAAVLCLGLSSGASAMAQGQKPTDNPYSRKNTFTLFAEGSTPSTPLLVGYARQRLFFDAGGAYTRRAIRFWGSDLGYHIELRPILFESDPLLRTNETLTITTGPSAGTVTTFSGSAAVIKCVPGADIATFPAGSNYPGETIATVDKCGRQWTFGQSFAPFGFKYSLRTAHRMQPFLIGTLGYMYTSRPVPLPFAEAFNFVINAGAGVELYRCGRRSISLEARAQHFSNRSTAPENPGTDNVTFKASYGFGR